MAWRTTASDGKGRPSPRAESRRVKQRTAADGRPLLTVARRSPSLAGLSPVARRSRPSSSVVGAAAAAASSSSSASSSSAAAAAASAAASSSSDPDQKLKAKLGELQDKRKRKLDERSALDRELKDIEKDIEKVRHLQAAYDRIKAALQEDA